MKDNKILPVVGILLSATMSASVHSSLLSIDDTRFGEGAITFDTDTQLEWLDLEFTLGRSVDDIQSELSNGGVFSGFRYATANEIATVFGNAGLPFNVTTTNEIFIQNVEELVDFVGETSETDGFFNVAAVSASGGASDSSRVLGAEFFYDGIEEAYRFGGLASIENSVSSDTVSHWLVKNVMAVSAPASAALFMFGGLAMCRVRKND